MTQAQGVTHLVGGELTLDSLELARNPASKTLEAPLQLKSNCGTFVIDDFGRQRMPVSELLNRWIVPLEKRFDFLNLPNGKKIQVPFDQLIVFSTNLEPRDLVDAAFLRRIVSSPSFAHADLDTALIESLHAQGFEIAVESNGTIAAPAGIDWVCISPKAGSTLVQTTGHELKVVVPQAGFTEDDRIVNGQYNNQ